MGEPHSLSELATWARGEPALTGVLAAPLEAAIDELAWPVADANQVVTALRAARVATFGDGLAHPALRAALGAMTLPRARDLLKSLYRALQAKVDEAAPSPLLLLPIDELHRPPQIEQVPVDPAAVPAWAKSHGVEALLTLPVKTLGSSVYYDDPHLRQELEGVTIRDLLDRRASPSARRGGAKGVSAWQRQAREHAMVAMLSAVRRYLFGAAQIRARILSRREDTARRADALPEPLVPLARRLGEMRTAFSKTVAERPLGSFEPDPATVELEPLRIRYMERADFYLGREGLSVVLAIEDENVAFRCDCPAGRVGPCTHALAAIDEALELLRAPSSMRDRLVSVLATPSWERFLRAFGDEVGPSKPSASDASRIVWRVTGSRLEADIEPLLQKRLKGGGYSQGQRLRVDQLRTHRRFFGDPRDARATAALAPAGEAFRMGWRGPPSQPIVARALEALAGHPLVFIAGSSVPARIVKRRLAVAVDADASGALSVAFRIGAVRYDAAVLAAHAGGAEGPIISVDAERAEITLATLDDRAQTLVVALARNPARFPPAAHDQILHALGSLQESVDLVLPDELTGEPVDADPRPVVRLSPHDSGEVDVQIVVRPVVGGPTLPPGEGAPVVLCSRDGRRVSARRDLARETAVATDLASVLPPANADAGPWTFVADEQAAVDLLAKLRDLGEGVTVEWPEPDRRMSLVVATSKQLRVRVTDKRDWFGVEGEVEVDGHAVSLAMLLDAVRSGRRYVRVGAGRFAAIEADLRQRIERASDVLHRGKGGLELSLPGAAFLEDLVEDKRALEAVARFRDLARRLDEAGTSDPALPEGLLAELRPYQVEGYKWLMRLASWGTGACLADDMGLGKTVQTLALLLARKDQGPALVIAPTSVGQNWIDEAARFAPGLRARLYRGPTRAAVLADARPGDLLVTSYAVVLRDAEALKEVRFSTLVLDEAQAVKNAQSRRARAVLGIGAELTVALTGTPVENHLGDLWSLMRHVAPGLLGSWEHFRDRFANGIERSKDAKRRAALARLLRPFLLRRTKAEVAPELPPRTEILRFVDPSPAERVLYDAARAAALETIAAGEGDARFALLAALTRLRRIACHPRLHDDASPIPSSKLAAFLEVVDELREEGHRALVFSQFTTHLALVREALDARGVTYDYLDGSTPAEDRAKRVAAFQAGGADLFLISLKAGGSGLNLTAADYVIHLDPWWNPAVEDQATDRAHRIGQTKAVTVIRLVTRGTIEEGVLALHGDKRALAASVFDEGASPAALSREDLAALIRGGLDAAVQDDESDAAGDEVVLDASVAAPPKKPEARGAAASSKPRRPL